MKGTTFSSLNSTFRNTTLEDEQWQEGDVLQALLNDCIAMMQITMNSLFQNQANEMAGLKNQHHPEAQRWGSNPGSVRINGMRVPMDIPRIRNKENKIVSNIPLYQEIRRQQEAEIQTHILDAILKGLSCRDYDSVLGAVNEHFGLSASSVSRKAKEAASQALKNFQERDLSRYDFVGLLIDGKYLAKQQMVIALGVTIEGYKIPIGLIQTTTENHKAIKALLQDLIGRGFGFTEGILCVIDGAKGLFKAVSEVFGEYCLIQRCRWHKRENILAYLNEEDRAYYKTLLDNAYREPNYELAKAKLLDVEVGLRKLNPSAANSLLEGLEQTLTLHRIGMNILFAKHFGTTNAIENVNSLLGKQLRNVKNWQDGDHRLRWTASALLKIEQKLRRLSQFEHLHKLRDAIKNELNLQS